jgi:Glycosyltransferase Family 4
MRVLITHAKFLLGGSETYAVTVAEQLERLGHEVTFFAGEASPQGRDLLASRGLRLETGEPGALAGRDDFDVVLAQDAAGAYAVSAERQIPTVFVVHGLALFEHPPQGLRPLPPVVVLNERMGEHVAAMGRKHEIVRLRQPIDIQRFKARPARPEARRVLVFSNYLQDDRMAMVQRACDDLGLELMTMGAGGRTSITPQEQIAAADIVVGYGRSVLEGMAMGRAAYVWDRGGGDGWVTPESYPELEADGFSGGATKAIIDVDRLRDDLAAYRPELGPLGYDLIRNHHSAQRHAEALIEVFERDPSTFPDPDPAGENLSLLARAGARLLDDVGSFENQLRDQTQVGDGLRAESADLLRRLEEVGTAGEIERQRRVAAEQRAQELEGQLSDVLGSVSWRLTAPLRLLGRVLRALLDR